MRYRPTLAVLMLTAAASLTHAEEDAAVVKRYEKFVRARHAEIMKTVEADFTAARTELGTIRAAKVSAPDAPLPFEGARIFTSPAEKSLAARNAYQAMKAAEALLIEARKGASAPLLPRLLNNLAPGTFGRLPLEPFDPGNGEKATPFIRVYHVNGENELSVRLEDDRPGSDERFFGTMASKPVVIRGLSSEGLEPGSKIESLSSDAVFEISGTAEFVEKDGATKYQEPLLIKRDLPTFLDVAGAKPAAESSGAAAEAAADPAADKPEWVERYIAFCKDHQQMELIRAQYELDQASRTLRNLATARIRPPKGPVPRGTGEIFENPQEKAKAVGAANAEVKKWQTLVDQLKKEPAPPFILDGSPPDGLFCRFDPTPRSIVVGADRTTTVYYFKVNSITGPDEMSGWVVTRTSRIVAKSLSTSIEPKGTAIFLRGLPTNGIKPEQMIQPAGTFEVVGTHKLVAPDGSVHMEPLLIKRDVDKYIPKARPGKQNPTDPAEQPPAEQPAPDPAAPPQS